MTTTNNFDAMFADPPEDGIVHYGPGDRPLCGNESSFAIYTDEPAQVAGCSDCLELVAEDLKDLDTQQEATASTAGVRLPRPEASSGGAWSGDPALTAGSPDGSSCIPTAGLYSNPASQPAIQSLSFPW